MDGEPAPEGRKNTMGMVVLIAAAAAAAAVGVYVFLAPGEKETPNTFGGSVFVDGTPLASLSGVTPAPNTGPLDSRRPEEGQPAPDFALIDARDGKTIRKLSDYRGKAVVLNWYASWCGPCKQEIPEFQRAYEALSNEMVVLGVDVLESRQDAAGILQELGATYPAVLDSSGIVTDHYRVGRGLPKTYFIDKEGILRATKTGQVSKDELVAFLKQAGVSYTPR